jgi:hypothetical protein
VSNEDTILSLCFQKVTIIARINGKDAAAMHRIVPRIAKQLNHVARNVVVNLEPRWHD